MRMKNFIFKSSTDSDLLKLFQKLDIIQSEQRHARYDLQEILKSCQTNTKALAILVSQPEPDLQEEIPELEDK